MGGCVAKSNKTKYQKQNFGRDQCVYYQSKLKTIIEIYDSDSSELAPQSNNYQPKDIHGINKSNSGQQKSSRINSTKSKIQANNEINGDPNSEQLEQKPKRMGMTQPIQIVSRPSQKPKGPSCQKSQNASKVNNPQISTITQQSPFSKSYNPKLTAASKNQLLKTSIEFNKKTQKSPTKKNEYKSNINSKYESECKHYADLQVSDNRSSLNLSQSNMSQQPNRKSLLISARGSIASFDFD